MTLFYFLRDTGWQQTYQLLWKWRGSREALYAHRVKSRIVEDSVLFDGKSADCTCILDPTQDKCDKAAFSKQSFSAEELTMTFMTLCFGSFGVVQPCQARPM